MGHRRALGTIAKLVWLLSVEKDQLGRVRGDVRAMRFVNSAFAAGLDALGKDMHVSRFPPRPYSYHDVTIALWHLDEIPNGGPVTTVVDQSTRPGFAGHPGTVAGAIAGVPGKFGTGFAFLASGSAITAASSPEFDIAATADATIEAFVAPGIPPNTTPSAILVRRERPKPRPKYAHTRLVALRRQCARLQCERSFCVVRWHEGGSHLRRCGDRGRWLPSRRGDRRPHTQARPAFRRWRSTGDSARSMHSVQSRRPMPSGSDRPPAGMSERHHRRSAHLAGCARDLPPCIGRGRRGLSRASADFPALGAADAGERDCHGQRGRTARNDPAPYVLVEANQPTQVAECPVRIIPAYWPKAAPSSRWHYTAGRDGRGDAG